MALTDQELADLEAAAFSGVVNVRHGDKSTSFADPASMIKLVDRARREARGAKRTKVHLARFSRGK